MISYELAKQLKDAGFPQESRIELGGIFATCPHDRSNDKYGEPHLCSEEVKVPTLSELIEACGNKLQTLGRFYGGWHANGNADFYETPEEAVAKLWLKLNE